MRGAVSMALAYNQVWSVTYKKESKNDHYDLINGVLIYIFLKERF